MNDVDQLITNTEQRENQPFPFWEMGEEEFCRFMVGECWREYVNIAFTMEELRDHVCERMEVSLTRLLMIP